MGWGNGPRAPTRGPPRGPRPRDRSGYDAGRDDPRDRDRPPPPPRDRGGYDGPPRDRGFGGPRGPPPRDRDGSAWHKYALLAALLAALWARTPSAPARRLERQLERGRALFEAGRWHEAVAALDLRKPAALLRTDAERRRFWPRLHEAAAHRAQSALRAADLAETAAARRRGVEQAV